jgi:hypothetical protein
MGWVRIHPFIPNWPGGGDPPVFEINSNENGEAVVELAWDPQALLHPATYPDLLRYYSSAHGLNGTISRDGGGATNVNVPAQRITLDANRATWVMPKALWDAYVEESLKTLKSPPTSTFSRNLYYRVSVTPPGGSKAEIWPSDYVLGSLPANAPPPGEGSFIDKAAAMAAPRIGILAMSATPASRVIPDTAAVQAMGGIPFAPKLWSTVLTAIWNTLPETDANRMSLATVFAHPEFGRLTVKERGDLLKLWLLSSKIRKDIPTLLSRNAVTGSGVLTPILKKTALKGGKTLLALLLDLFTIHIHPDLVIMSRDELVADVLHEVLDPNGRVNQGAAGTCAPTSMQAMLITVNPAEYVRLQTGWLSSAAKVELANGGVAAVPRGILQVTRYSQPGAPASTGLFARNYSELAFQGACVKFAYGSSFPADSGNEASANAIFKFVHDNGLFPDQSKKLLEALFGVAFTLSDVAPSNASDTATRQVNIADALFAALPAKQQQVLVASYWTTAPQSALPAGKKHVAHAVLALRHEGGRLFYKNPQYAGTSPPWGATNGGSRNDPPGRYENLKSTLESIADADLKQWIFWFATPDSAII